MNFFTFTKLGRAVLLSAMVMVIGMAYGETYDFVTIGGKKWMKQNLNVTTKDSWCYGEGGRTYVDGNYKTLTSSEIQANCKKYGRLYTWSAAKSACQSIGWRLPTNEEWEKLVTIAGGETVAGDKLKARSGWRYNILNGTDNYGFSALPGGGRIGEYFGGDGDVSYWWTATELAERGMNGEVSNSYYSIKWGGAVEDGGDETVRMGEGPGEKNWGLSVRCVKD